MTESEAKKNITAYVYMECENMPEDVIKALDVAKVALDRRTAEKPTYEGDGYANGVLVYDTWICPCCEHRYEVDYDDYEYCPKCGQKIDWSEENEEIN